MMKQDCTVCRIIRTYLLVAVPLLALVGSASMQDGYLSSFWITDVLLIDLMAWGCLTALIVIISWRAYQEYFLPRKRKKRLEQIKASVSGGQRSASGD